MTLSDVVVHCMPVLFAEIFSPLSLSLSSSISWPIEHPLRHVMRAIKKDSHKKKNRMYLVIHRPRDLDKTKQSKMKKKPDPTDQLIDETLIFCIWIKWNEPWLFSYIVKVHLFFPFFLIKFVMSINVNNNNNNNNMHQKNFNGS